MTSLKQDTLSCNLSVSSPRRRDPYQLSGINQFSLDSRFRGNDTFGLKSMSPEYSVTYLSGRTTFVKGGIVDIVYMNLINLSFG